MLKHVQQQRWSAFVLCANNRADIKPALERAARVMTEYPVGTKLFQTNRDNYRSDPYRTIKPILLGFIDNRPPRMRREKPRLPPIPKWALPLSSPR